MVFCYKFVQKCYCQSFKCCVINCVKKSIIKIFSKKVFVVVQGGVEDVIVMQQCVESLIDKVVKGSILYKNVVVCKKSCFVKVINKVKVVQQV